MLAAIAELVGAVQAPPQPALTESKPQDTAERRQITVMFSDLVGSTALSGRMDPEDLREVISAYQKCVAQTAQLFGGFVAKYMSDGVLVYFGYPQAHENDAEHAVRAGLEHPFSHTYALGLFFCHWTGQDVDQTLQRAEKVIALSTEYGFPMFQLLATMVRGWCLAALGQPEVGIAQLQQGVSLWRSSRAEVGVPFMLTLLADAYGKAGSQRKV